MVGDCCSSAQPAGLSSTPPAEILNPSREVAVFERPSKRSCHALGSTSSASSGRYVWAGLTNNLLHQIILLFGSFHEFLAVTSTCSSWRAAVSSFSPVYSFNFPPLHLKIGVRYAHQYCDNGIYNPLSNYIWQLRDLSRKSLSLHCSASRNTPNYMCYVGCSYGYFVFCCVEDCLLVDIYTGAKVKPPKVSNGSYREIYYGTLTAPLSSPNSRLILFSRKSMFQWQVGTNSMMEHPLVAGRILQVVVFRDQILAMSSVQRLYTISLEPEVGVREVADVWGEEKIVGVSRYNPWLVVCNDMLLMVHLSINPDPPRQSYPYLSNRVHHSMRTDRSNGFRATFQVFRLDFSTKPAKWVKMEKLENLALFVGLDRRSPTFSCINPERWGGKSNCIYIPGASKDDSSEPWMAVNLGQSVSSRYHPVLYSLAGKSSSQLESLWVLPSLVYGVEQ